MNPSTSSYARVRVAFVLCLLILSYVARAEAQQAAQPAVALPAEKATSYGLGWSVASRNGQRAIGHSGAQQRVSTFLHMQPEQGLAVVLMSNLEGARLGDLAQQIGDIVLK
ncbi:MAG: serine beta-lactamase-like protein mitochondrial [Acidobacteriota bacterium]|jgi:CubicO group peptidase (beta-lactamase class C family)|nr:serine beta-lactamase-like protein mitochondrial [Acidobacteriota bacterium]